jgi:hypothetical protein
MKQVTGGIVKWFHPQHGVKKNKPKKKKKKKKTPQQFPIYTFSS